MLILPIKCQGIKTKIVPIILENIFDFNGKWVEPFMGSGVVGLNVNPNKAIFSDSNIHIINFYNSIKSKEINKDTARIFLEKEGSILKNIGEDHYYQIRERFNNSFDPLDFLFLSRSCFNGMIRFNKKGKFNVPFCRKNNRFSKAYVTKIVNQIDNFSKRIKSDWIFLNQDFEKTIIETDKEDLIYCDPPYIDRHSDYFNSWNKSDEEKLYDCLSKTKSKFILSTWIKNKYRKNEYFDKFWSKYKVVKINHFYHIGGKEENRNPMEEALIINF